MSFTKLDSGIVDSSLWAYPAEERIVWITLLAKADETGFVRISFSGLVRAANVSEEATRRAIEKFTAPDNESRTEEYGGRRIERLEGGWIILNYMKYREKTDRDAHREYMRKYRESRVNHSNLQTLTVESPSVSVSGSVSGSEKEGSGEKGHKPQFVKPTIEEVKAYCTERKNGISAQAFIDHYESNGWMIGKNKMKSWQAAVRTWEHNQHEKNPGQKIGQVIGDRGEVLIYGKRRTDF